MPLTELQIRNARTGEKIIQLGDDRGLYLEVHPNGSKLWRYKYRHAAKQKRLALGRYPDVGAVLCDDAVARSSPDVKAHWYCRIAGKVNFAILWHNKDRSASGDTVAGIVQFRLNRYAIAGREPLQCNFYGFAVDYLLWQIDSLGERWGSARQQYGKE